MKPLVCDTPKDKGRLVSGFTLTEMLVTMLILTLASTLMAMGIPVAADTYQKTVKTANAQVALSTTIAVLKSELGMAQEITNEGTRVRYRTTEGYFASIGNAQNTDENHVSNGLDKKYFTEDGTEVYDYGLISDSAITNELRVACDSIAKDESTDQVIVNNLRVIDASNPSGTPLARVEEYRILTRCDR